VNTNITLIENPELRSPVLVAAWPGMGLVGLKAVQFLRDECATCKLAEINPSDFFRIAGIIVKDGILDAPSLPKSEFFLFSPPAGTRDVIVFVGEDQPAAGREYAFASLVMEVAEHYGVEHVYTAAAMVTSLNHTQPSRVWAAATASSVLDDLPADSFVPLVEGNIGGLNGLLLGVARERGINGTCILGEIPYYVTNLENPKATSEVLKLLATILRFELDLAAMEQQAIFVENQIDSAVRKVKQNAGNTLEEIGDSADSSLTDDDNSSGAIN